MERVSQQDGIEHPHDQGVPPAVQQCRTDVRHAVNTEDPEGLLRLGTPRDEDGPEIDDLVRLVLDRSVTPETVLQVWERWFGPDSSMQRDPEALQRLTSALRRLAAPPS